MALNLLAKKSPQTAAMIADMIKRGEDPSDALRRFASEGKINPKQLGELRQTYNMARKMGFKKFSVPDNVWDEAERAMTANNVRQASDNDWF